LHWGVIPLLWLSPPFLRLPTERFHDFPNSLRFN